MVPLKDAICKYPFLRVIFLVLGQFSNIYYVMYLLMYIQYTNTYMRTNVYISMWKCRVRSPAFFLPLLVYIKLKETTLILFSKKCF